MKVIICLFLIFISDYFERIVPDLSYVRRGASVTTSTKGKIFPSGILLIMPNSVVHVLEGSYQTIVEFLKTLELHQEIAFPTEGVQSEKVINAINSSPQGAPIIPRAASLITSVRVMYYTDDIPRRAFTTWTAHSINKQVPPDPDMLGITEKQVLKCLESVLALGQV